MALVFMDSFDHYGSSDITEKWPLANATTTIVAGAGRRGTNALRCAGNFTYAGRLFTPGSTWTIGMSMRFVSSHPAVNPIMDWSDGSAGQAHVRVTGVGQIEICRGSTSTPVVLATSTVGLGFNTTYYLEWALTIHPSTGSSTVRVDGIPVVSASGVSTQGASTALANRLRVGNLESILALGNLDIDDLYVCNALGSVNTSFLGDCRVDYLPPVGDGTYRAWTPSSGTSHFALVDEVPPNDDTDYLGSVTAGDRDTQTFPTLPAMPNPVVRGVQHTVCARKDDAGTRLIRNLLLSGASTQVGSTAHTLALSYVTYQQLYESDPATGTAWTTAAVNAVEAGVENQ